MVRMRRRRAAGRDQRKAQRLVLPVALTYRILPAENRRRSMRNRAVSRGLAIARNISGTGLRVVLPQPLAIGDRLELAFCFPQDPAPIVAVSQVRWCEKRPRGRPPAYEVGLCHVSIRAQDRERFVLQFCETMINQLLHRTALAVNALSHRDRLPGDHDGRAHSHRR